MNKEIPQPNIEIKEMPQQDLLERFLEQMINGGEVTVVFDYNQGKFVEVKK